MKTHLPNPNLNPNLNPNPASPSPALAGPPQGRFLKALFSTAALSFALALAAQSAPIEFDFKDPKGVNTAVFKLDAPLESVDGSANGISGTVTFDPEDPAATKGKIVVQSVSLHVGNPMQKEHLHGANWMEVKKYPEITFETVSVNHPKTSGNATTMDVTGKMTIKGITKTITVPVKLTYLKDKLQARTGKPGDLLVLRATFTIHRRDFGINPGQFEDKVSDEIALSLSIAGAAPR